MFISVMLLLTACGSNSSGTESKPATKDTQGKVFEHKFGEVFYYHRTNSLTNVTSKVAITLSDYELVKEKSTDDYSKNDADYIKVYVQVENVGNENSTEWAILFSSFKSYDENGKEISGFTKNTNMEGEFKPSELRPGGKNEGFMYIPIIEGAIPAEIIYFDGTGVNSNPNQYVFKL